MQVKAAVASVHWRDIALASLLLWVLAIIAAAWWFLRGRGTRDRAPPVAPAPDHDAPASAPVDAHILRKRALDAARSGDAAASEHALLAWARAERPAISHAGSLRAALSDQVQKDALDALQRARWQGGDAAPACIAVASTFAHGFAWRDDDRRARTRDPDLPPLYPP